MQTNCTYIPYNATGNFSKLVLDYLNDDEALQQFYKHPVSLDGIKAAIKERKQAPNPRNLLVSELRKQYAGIDLTDLQEKNLFKLTDENTFTICTAHQPNIFTGHLYFIYKILHAIKLCQSLNAQLQEHYFVPVYYMGSEDADLDELGNITIDGKKLKWTTNQTGAVGRMKVDADFIKIIDEISGQLSMLQFGNELITLFKSSYTLGATIQQATLILVNELFKSYGLIILIPDNAALKKPFNEVVKRELTEQFSHPLVEKTTQEIGKNYKVQAGGRDINLFYLTEDQRERIIASQDKFQTPGATWSKEEILKEVDEHPERFSANVILRGVFQEMILPNVAFIGGGGEIAYWLELKSVFETCDVPFPVLVLRNSYLLIEQREKQLTEKLSINLPDLFKSEFSLAGELVNYNTKVQLSLNDELVKLQQFYDDLLKLVSAVDVSLNDHVINLKKKAEKTIEALQKKILRAEKKKFDAELRQLNKLKQQLFPNNNLQERVENFSTYYAKYGKEWIDTICNASLTTEQRFTILEL